MQAPVEAPGYASSEACVRGHLRKRPHRDPPPPAASETGCMGEAEAGVAGFEGEPAGGALFFLRSKVIFVIFKSNSIHINEKSIFGKFTTVFLYNEWCFTAKRK